MRSKLNRSKGSVQGGRSAILVVRKCDSENSSIEGTGGDWAVILEA